MTDAVMRRKTQMIQLANEIKAKAEGMIEDIRAIDTDDDLAIIEMGFDQIRAWGKEGYDIVLNTYDEFEED